MPRAKSAPAKQDIDAREDNAVEALQAALDAIPTDLSKLDRVKVKQAMMKTVGKGKDALTEEVRLSVCVAGIHRSV